VINVQKCPFLPQDVTFVMWIKLFYTITSIPTTSLPLNPRTCILASHNV